MIVEVLAVGTELLLGQIVNSNATEIGRRLAEAGLDHYRQSVVGDNLGRIAVALREALARADAVIVTGGLGPTQDDLTREAIAEVAGRDLVLDATVAEAIRARARAMGRQLPPSNLRMAEHPEGATLLPNRYGTAPGLEVRIGDKTVVAVPGVPREMIPMIEDEVIPRLVAATGRPETVVSRVLYTWGLWESEVAHALSDLFDRSTDPTIAFLASGGEIKVRLTTRAPTREAAAAVIAPVEVEVRRLLGDAVFAVDDTPVEAMVAALLGERGWRLGTAELGTGGAVAARLSTVAGAGFAGGVVAGAAGSALPLLDADPSTLAGEAGARALLAQVATATGAEVAAVSLPFQVVDPTQARPATHVTLGVETPEGAEVHTVVLAGDPAHVRSLAVTALLHLTRRALQGAWGWSGYGRPG